MTNVLQNLIEKNVNDQKRLGRSWLLEHYCYYYYYYYYSHFKASFYGNLGKQVPDKTSLDLNEARVGCHGIS